MLRVIRMSISIKYLQILPSLIGNLGYGWFRPWASLKFRVLVFKWGGKLPWQFTLSVNMLVTQIWILKFLELGIEVKVVCDFSWVMRMMTDVWIVDCSVTFAVIIPPMSRVVLRVAVGVDCSRNCTIQLSPLYAVFMLRRFVRSVPAAGSISFEVTQPRILQFRTSTITSKGELDIAAVAIQ